MEINFYLYIDMYILPEIFMMSTSTLLRRRCDTVANGSSSELVSSKPDSGFFELDAEPRCNELFGRHDLRI
jgi:hypothetical protein